jgi:hypothetical protein
VLCPENTGSSYITTGDEPGTEVIEIRRLDDVINNESETIGLIKIDVEGHEYEALLGGERVIKSNNPVILFEQQPQEISNGSSRTIDLLIRCGYSQFAVLQRHPAGKNFLT